MRFVWVITAMAFVAMSGCFSAIYNFQEQRTAPGQLALDYIRGNRPILVEIHYVDGNDPPPAALANFQSEMQGILGKNLTITQTGEVPGQGASHKYTWSEINNLEGSVRQHWTDGNQAVLFVLVLDGGSESDSSDGSSLVLGAAYHGASVVIFQGNVNAISSSSASVLSLSQKPSTSDVEQAVLIHEFGHIIGLVDNGIPMVTDHEDHSSPQGQHHSSNKNDVMYWAVESNAALNVLFLQQNSIPWHFDANDKADVAAARS
ncbi:MAG: hypothetical protein ACYDDF_06750 [Thermoplasmatota archaeon]